MATKKEPITAKSLTKELMTKEKMDYVIHIIKEFQGICSRMNKINQSLDAAIDYHSSECTDIIHDIEFSDLDYTTASRKAKLLQKARKERREAKDLHDYSVVIKNFVEASKINSELDKLMNNITKIQNDQQNRLYKPRASDTLEERIRSKVK